MAGAGLTRRLRRYVAVTRACRCHSRTG
jgi:hypothetical protein